jgi:hypothetical protein
MTRCKSAENALSGALCWSRIGVFPVFSRGCSDPVGVNPPIANWLPAVPPRRA